MRREMVLANPAERGALRRFALRPVAGTVRLAAFYGLYTPAKAPADGVAEVRPAAPAARPSGPTPAPKPFKTLGSSPGRDAYFDAEHGLGNRNQHNEGSASWRRYESAYAKATAPKTTGGTP